MGMNKKSPAAASDLFTVRVWTEEADDEETVFHGQVLHVQSGETRYFRDWPTLIQHIQTLLGANSGSAR